MSTLKVGTIQEHENSNTVMTFSNTGDITMGGHVLNAHTPMFKLTGRTDTSYTPPINNSTAFQFAATDFATNGFSVTNTFSRVTVPVSGKYYIKTVIQHSGPSVNTETRYMGTNIRKNSAYISQNLEALVAVSDGSLKTNIQPLENSLDVINKLKGVTSIGLTQIMMMMKLDSSLKKLKKLFLKLLEA